jgi:threonine dehydrogenase-like Zn-dependent dehydrogenase
LGWWRDSVHTAAVRAFVITAPGTAGVQEVDQPAAMPGEVVVDVARAGVCGTDAELFDGGMQYLRDGLTTYPVRIGHEWMGTVSAVGEGVDRRWVGRRVTGDTMLGCGRCLRCREGYQHVCEFRAELGILGRPGALAEQVAVPATALRELPDQVDDVQGALVEPGGNALRAVRASALQPGDRLLVLGPGTIGVLAAMFARAAGIEVHLMGHPGHRSLPFAASLGFDGVWTADTLPGLPWDAVIDATNAPQLPPMAVDLVEPGKRLVYIGLSASPSLIDTRGLVLKDVTAVGILGASAGLDGAIEAYARGDVNPAPLVAATVSLEDLAPVLAGQFPDHAGPGPKVHVTI